MTKKATSILDKPKKSKERNHKEIDKENIPKHIEVKVMNKMKKDMQEQYADTSVERSVFYTKFDLWTELQFVHQNF